MKVYIKTFSCCGDCPHNSWEEENVTIVGRPGIIKKFQCCTEPVTRRLRTLRGRRVSSMSPKPPLWCRMPELSDVNVIIKKLREETKDGKVQRVRKEG